MKDYMLTIELLSPLHLGSGEADIIVDAEVVHDTYGIPYCPGGRLKGLLYESALELSEMFQDDTFTQSDIQNIFGHGTVNASAFTIDNLYIADYRHIIQDWTYLQQTFPSVYHPKAVLQHFTSRRYQTAIGEDGRAADGSLRNLRVVNEGLHFHGYIHIHREFPLVEKILDAALLNLRYAGAKRHRGLGRIRCSWSPTGGK